ncbi:hypothetical protein DFH08DRAFT_964284 [Mycena albidolilacea]|uniref:Uncharacterized protein n=1 Tax=Mycena albidolilacea TaxID=1033008 RepID=A0AAD6ZU85_9AGAR|nr:hypothetical protein DFH08DRAFT_964284 [Mycena albidolilacea]
MLHRKNAKVDYVLSRARRIVLTLGGFRTSLTYVTFQIVVIAHLERFGEDALSLVDP